MRSFITYMSFAVLALLFFTATAAAATAVAPPDGSLLDLARPVFDAVMHGQYWIAASLALVLTCAAVRKYGAARWPALNDGGLPAIALLYGMSFGGALATGLAAIGTNAISVALVLTSAKIALAAAGGWSLIKHLGEWLTSRTWYQDKAPAWLKTLVSLALWAFARPSAGESRRAEASAAGDAAVKASPAKGVAGIIGTPEEL